MNPQNNPQHQEGELAKSIEEETAKLPSDIFLWAALGFHDSFSNITMYQFQKAQSFCGTMSSPIPALRGL